MAKPYEYTQARRRVWTHNAAVGGLHMALVCVRRITEGASFTPEAKRKAQLLILQLQDLIPEAKRRIDP